MLIAVVVVVVPLQSVQYGELNSRDLDCALPSLRPSTFLHARHQHHQLDAVIHATTPGSFLAHVLQSLALSSIFEDLLHRTAPPQAHRSPRLCYFIQLPPCSSPPLRCHLDPHTSLFPFHPFALFFFFLLWDDFITNGGSRIDPEG